MSTDVLPIFARGLWGTIAEAAAAGHVERWSVEAVEQAISHCQLARKAARGIRRQQEELLGNGVEARTYAAQTEPLVVILGRCIDSLSPLVEGLAGRDLAPPLTAFLAEAQYLVREATDLRDFLAEAVARANTPSRPIDWQRLQENVKAYERGEAIPFPKSATEGDKDCGEQVWPSTFKSSAPRWLI
jgi:hypothetical protein